MIAAAPFRQGRRVRPPASYAPPPAGLVRLFVHAPGGRVLRTYLIAAAVVDGIKAPPYRPVNPALVVPNPPACCPFCGRGVA